MTVVVLAAAAVLIAVGCAVAVSMACQPLTNGRDVANLDVVPSNRSTWIAEPDMIRDQVKSTIAPTRKSFSTKTMTASTVHGGDGEKKMMMMSSKISCVPCSGDEMYQTRMETVSRIDALVIHLPLLLDQKFRSLAWTPRDAIDDGACDFRFPPEMMVPLAIEGRRIVDDTAYHC
jgi:hypothetical protein